MAKISAGARKNEKRIILIINCAEIFFYAYCYVSLHKKLYETFYVTLNNVKIISLFIFHYIIFNFKHHIKTIISRILIQDTEKSSTTCKLSEFQNALIGQFYLEISIFKKNINGNIIDLDFRNYSNP